MKRRHWKEPRQSLMRFVAGEAKRFGLNREMLGEVVEDAASQMSRLMTGYDEFSNDRLLHYAKRLGADVPITIRPAPKLGRRGKLRVKVVRRNGAAQ